MLLLAHEQKSGPQGVTPTALSRFQGVSRNTISSLLRGLEEQGYVERTLDPHDYRVFRIRLTNAGREVVRSLAPERVAFMNQLAAGLSLAEREELIRLLEKLHDSIMAHAGFGPGDCHELS
jgi:DNA-binding MarR family transcriptional regulator